MFASGLSKGFYERGEQRNRQRREIANAFNQFKQQNPEATLQDFQSFIDAQVGNGLGSNYLRGGAPSKEVLGSIADDNLRNKNRRIAEQTRNDIMAQGDLSGYLSGMMDKALLNANPQKLEDAKSTFLSGLSPEAQQAVTNSGTLNNWTESRYNFLQGQRMMTMLPQIDTYLKLKNYSLDEITPEKMASAFGIQPYEAKQFVDAAKNSMSLQMTEWWQNNNAGIQAAAERAAQKPGATRASIEEAVKFQLQNSPLADNFLTEYKPLLDGLVTEAEELTKQRENALDNAAGQRQRKFALEVKQNDGLMNFIRNSDEAGALERLKDLAELHLNPEDIKKLYNVDDPSKLDASVFRGLLDEQVTLMQNQQQANYAKAYEDFEGKARELTSGFNEKNIANLNAALKTGLGDDMAGQLAYTLGGEYYATSDLANKVFAAIRNMPEDVDNENQAAVVQYIKDTVGQTAIPLNQALISQKGMLEERNGLYAPQGFDEFIRSESDQLITSMADMDSDYRDALSKYGSDPAKLIAALNQLSQGIIQFESGLGREMQTRERNQLNWLKPNSGGYNPVKIKSEILDPARNKIAAMSEMIQSTIKTATEKLNQQPEVVEGPTVDDARTDVSPVGGFVGDTVNSFGVTRDIANAINSANRGGPVGTILTPIVGAGREIYENTMLSEEENERRDGVRSWVGNNEDRLNEFGTLTQQYQPEMYRKLLNDLSTMTAEQIEEAYGYLLDKLAKDRKLPTQ